MFLPLLVEDAVWYGPATATFRVQYPGDPYDPARNDVRVRFIGDRNQREERSAYFDPSSGAWRATLFSKEGGRYRAVLVRNGKDASVEADEGILELEKASALGILPAKTARTDRLVLDTGATWLGFGVELPSDATPTSIEALAKAGATWVRIVPPANPLDDDTLAAFGVTMDAVEDHGLAYTLVLPASSSDAWRRYALSRFGSSPRLVGWEAAPEFADPWSRSTAATTVTWDRLFENLPGPFLLKATDLNRIKALRTLADKSGWADWRSPRAWKGSGAKGVAESDRLILFATPGAKLSGIPIADGSYDVLAIDPATGESTTSVAVADNAALALPIPAERFFVLRRKI